MSDMPAFVKFACVALILVAASGAFVATDVLRDKYVRTSTAELTTGGAPHRAAPIFRRYGCAGCHTIPGIAGADGQVGPALADMSKRVYVAGVLENSPENLLAWIIAPETISPQTAMPTTGISAQETRDLVAYLYAQ